MTNPLLEQFLIEARDFLGDIGQKLLLLEEAPGDDQITGEIFRLVHTLKGNSGLFDMPSLTSVVHAAEDLLDCVRDHTLDVKPALTDTLLEAMDFISLLLDDVEDTGSISGHHSERAAEIAGELRSLLPIQSALFGDVSETETPKLSPPADWSWLGTIANAERLAVFDGLAGKAHMIALRYAPEPDCFFKGEDPIQLIRTLPGLALFSVSVAEPWPDAAMLDIYRCNLIFDALCDAAAAEIEHHTRYVREQVAIYQIPAFALALPDAVQNAEAGIVAPLFLDQGTEALARGDLGGLANSANAALDMLNPESAAAGILGWISRLAAANAPVSALAPLLQMLSGAGQPDWHAIAQSFCGQPSMPAIEQTESTHAAHTPGALPQFQGASGLTREIAAAQVAVLSSPTPARSVAGRLASVRNTLASLLSAAGWQPLTTELDAAFHDAVSQRDPAPLQDFIENRILFPIVEVEPETRPTAQPPMQIEAPSLEPSLEALSTVPPRPPATGMPADPRDDRELEPVDGGARRPGGEAGGDRGMRVLKVPQEKVDRLMDLIGEMVVAKNALPYLAARAEDHFGSRELSREIKAQYMIINRIAEEMQDGIMQVRMLPVGAVFQRFPRLVRDVARQLGKVVRLTVEGEETEADKNIVESLADPMIHILRNSLDHGLETPDMRRASGKPEEGRLTVRAAQEGDRVLIEIEDDGRGIDPAVIRRKAFEKGLIDEQRLEALTDAEAIQLVFAPGFSTAEQVSNLSGRGVGMDVVKSSLERVGGQVRLTSEKGKGTRIQLSLPLSMSVSNVMMVHIDGQQFGVPMEAVVETVRVAREDIHTFKDQRTVVLRGRIVPLYSAHALLRTGKTELANADDEYAVLIVRVAGQTLGIIVDGFAQTIDVILKPLEGPLAHLSGFSGSALLGDGSVLLVLNLKELL